MVAVYTLRYVSKQMPLLVSAVFLEIFLTDKK
jgi:hypothetical protein